MRGKFSAVIFSDILSVWPFLSLFWHLYNGNVGAFSAVPEVS